MDTAEQPRQGSRSATAERPVTARIRERHEMASCELTLESHETPRLTEEPLRTTPAEKESLPDTVIQPPAVSANKQHIEERQRFRQATMF